MSAGVLDGYRLFRSKCGQCHSLNQSATKSEASVHDWTNMVFRMQDMPSSHMSETQSKAIVTFVVWQADYSNDLVKTLMAFDKDGDGKLSKSEVPERMQGMFDRADTNRDGMLTPEEIRKYAEAQDPSLAAASGNCGPDHQTKK
jgi:Ca2+-binding EF-hand superfamily protein